MFEKDCLFHQTFNDSRRGNWRDFESFYYAENILNWRLKIDFQRNRIQLEYNRKPSEMREMFSGSDVHDSGSTAEFSWELLDMIEASMHGRKTFEI